MKAIIHKFSLLLLLFSIGNSPDEAKVIHIEPFKDFQHYEHFKRLTLRSDLPEIEYINGFEFDWGYQYTLSVEERKLPHTLSDGTRFEYQLKSVISKTKVHDSVTFNLKLDGNLYYNSIENAVDESWKTLEKLNDSIYFYFEEVAIEVPKQYREQFESIAYGEKTARGKFQFFEKNRIRLIHL